jgi:hypothetical protein
MTGPSSGTRALWLLLQALAAGASFVGYEELRRAREKDFPFLWEPLFLHSLLLVATVVIIAVMIRTALQGTRGHILLASVLIGGPSLVLAFAPYIVSVLEWAFFPDRLVGDGFHQLGVAGFGLAVGLLLIGWRWQGGPNSTARQAVE